MNWFTDAFYYIAGKADAIIGHKGKKIYINKVIREYGEMTKIEIDKDKKTVEASFDLNGEEKPITIKIKGYTIESDGKDTSIKIGDVSVSRGWLDTIAKKFLKKKEFPATGFLAGMLKQIL